MISNKRGILCILGKPLGYKNKYSEKCSFKKPYDNNIKKNSEINKKYFIINVNKTMENIGSE